MLEDAEVDCADCVGEKSLEAQVKGEPLTPDELKAREAQEFLGDITKHIMKAQTTEIEAKAIIAKRASLDSTRAKYTDMLGNDLDRHHKVLLRLIGTMKKMVTETPEPNSIPTVVDSFKKMVSDHLELLQWAQKFDLADRGAGEEAPCENGLTDRLLVTLLAETQCENGGLTDRGFCVGERVPNGWRVDFCG